MKKMFRQKFWEMLLIILIFISIYIYVENILCLRIEVFLTGIASLITVYLSFVKQKIEDDKVFKELFIDFNEKYSGKTNDLFNELRNDDTRILTPNDKLLIIDYLNLCAEEYLWYSNGRIPRKVWVAWKSGIKENLSIPVVKEIFDLETNSETKIKSYYGFPKEIKAKL